MNFEFEFFVRKIILYKFQLKIVFTIHVTQCNQTVIVNAVNCVYFIGIHVLL